MKAGGAPWAIVPVKRFAAAKSRLSPVLRQSERAELARAMVEDVLDVLSSCRGILAGTMVVTSEAAAVEIARARGAAVAIEAHDDGINEAVRQVLVVLAPSDGAGALVMPSDIPQVTRRAVTQAAAALCKPAVLAMAAAARDGGTNLLGCRPANAMPLRFGPGSFERHRRAASEAGLSLSVLDLPELSLDIDCPEDIGPFLALNTCTRTHALLSGLGVDPRGSLAERQALPMRRSYGA
jgi:2-phospho-L-lactate/phosphoenolpyruvate guanylyltransferase